MFRYERRLTVPTHMFRHVTLSMSLAAALGIAWCGTSAPAPDAPTGTTGAVTTRTVTTSTTVSAPAGMVTVSGTVQTICPGPLRADRPPHCLNSAVLQSATAKVTLRGTFAVTVAPDTYHVTVDGCPHDKPLRVTGPLTRVQLWPDGCAIPL